MGIDLAIVAAYFGVILVIGIRSRAKPGEDVEVRAHLHRRVLGRLFHALLSIIVPLKDYQGQRIRDTQCGFKWMKKKASRAIWPKMTIDGFGFDVEFLYLAARLGFLASEVPVNWADRSDSRVNLMLDPLRMFWQVCTIRIKHRRIPRN